MEIDEENVSKRIRRKKPLAPDRKELFSRAFGYDDRPPEVVATSKNKSVDHHTGAEEKENQKEKLELLVKMDREIDARVRKNLQVLGDRLPDKGDKLKAIIRRCEIELERRNKLRSEKKYSTTSSPECLAGIKPPESQYGVANNALGNDSLNDERMQKIVDELVNVGISKVTDVGKAAEFLYNYPVKAKVLFALPSRMRRSYVDGLLHPQN